jgi:hypothetical protein
MLDRFPDLYAQFLISREPVAKALKLSEGTFVKYRTVWVSQDWLARTPGKKNARHTYSLGPKFDELREAK